MKKDFELIIYTLLPPGLGKNLIDYIIKYLKFRMNEGDR